MEEIVIPVNKFQTPVTRELLDTLPEEVQEQLIEFLCNVEFIKRLVSPDRKYARDLERDDKGRIKIDITNPHIIEDADYFRPAALHYLKHGCYTFLRPNSNPNSEYRKFWDEERRRCWEGYVRESDGEWITGLCYWFLNYCPMMVNEIKEGSKKAERKESFPYFFEGIYWRFHYLHQARELGKHAIELAKRGCAKSYSLAAIMSRNLILGESEEVRKRIITVLTAYEKEKLSDSKDGTLSKFRPEINFIFSNTPFPKLMLKNSPNEMTWQMGYKDEYGIERGSFNQVLGVSAKDDPDKLRGKRGWILFEEMGDFKGLLALYDSTRRSTEDGGYTFATMYLVGTANNKESDFSSAKTMLYAPDGYNIMFVDNVYDKPNQGKDVFGFFFPAYVNRLGCYNKDGVSDVVAALLEILLARYKAKYSADPQSVLRVIAEDPITPAEAIIKVKDAYFPVAALTERLVQLDADPNAFSDVYVGNLVLAKNGEVNFNISDGTPIRDFPVPNDTVGAIEIFNLPEKDNYGKVYSERYIIGVDPVDSDTAMSHSLYSMFVFDLFTDKIVAEYTGRLQFTEDMYEITRLMCMFYNAKCLYENNLKGLYGYFQKMNSTHWLADCPEFLKDKQLVKFSGIGNQSKGVHATAAINNYANQLIREWLIKGVDVTVNEEGEERHITMPNLSFIRNRALLKELIDFRPELNVDRIRALGMVMIYREEKMILYNGDIKLREDSPDGLSVDKYFTENYDDRFFD